MLWQIVYPAVAAFPADCWIVPVVDSNIFVDMKPLLWAEKMADHGLRGHVHPSMLDVRTGAQDQLKEVLHPPGEPPVQAMSDQEIRIKKCIRV